MVKAHQLYSATNRKLQLQRRCVTDEVGVQSMGRRLSLAHTRLWYCDHTATRSPGLPCNGLHPRVIHWLLLIYRPRRVGRLSWLVWLIMLIHSGHLTHKWSDATIDQS